MPETASSLGQASGRLDRPSAFRWLSRPDFSSQSKEPTKDSLDRLVVHARHHLFIHPELDPEGLGNVAQLLQLAVFARGQGAVAPLKVPEG